MGKRGYNIGEVSLILVILILLVAVAAYSVFAACLPGFTTHGVEICGIHYNCSPISDGVCPNDFNTSVANFCCHDASCAMGDADCTPSVCAGSNLPNGSLTFANCSLARGWANDSDCNNALTVNLTFDGGRIQQVSANGISDNFTHLYVRDVLQLLGDNGSHTVAGLALGISSACSLDNINRALWNPRTVSNCGFFNWVRGNHSAGNVGVAWVDNLSMYRAGLERDDCVRADGAIVSGWNCVPGFNPGGNDNFAACTSPGLSIVTNGTWFDVDNSSNACNICGAAQTRWLKGGESAAFGEYDTGTSTECCGDDANEYNISGLCCNSATDLNVSGVCTPVGSDILPNGSFLSATCLVATGNASDPNCATPINVNLTFDGGHPQVLPASGANHGFSFTYATVRAVLEHIGDNAAHTLVATALGVDAACAPNGLNTVLLPTSRNINSCGYFNWLKGFQGVSSADIAWADDSNIFGMNASQSACISPDFSGFPNGSCRGGLNLGGNDNWAVCTQSSATVIITGGWFDTDNSSAACSLCGSAATQWLQGGETVAFGEYTLGNEIECCGDDANEYNISNRCCNSATDNVVGGICVAAGASPPNIAFLSSTCSGVSGTASDPDNNLCAINVTLDFGGGIVRRVLTSAGSFSYNYDRTVLQAIGNGAVHSITAIAHGVSSTCANNSQDTQTVVSINGGSACGYFNWFRGSSVAWADNTNMYRLCGLQSDCLNLSNISRSTQFCAPGFNAGANDNYAVCSPAGGAGLWYDPDTSATACGYCAGLSWLQGGESAVFGEYDTGTSTECCGDDANEYRRNNPINGHTACCNAANDVVNSSGACITYALESPGVNCADGQDNDGNGYNDWDTAGWVVPSRAEYHGDPGCAVGVGIVSVSTASPFANTIINVTCSVNAGNTNVDSAYAYIDNDNNNMFTAGDVDCGWIDVTDYWFASNTRVNINCNVGATGAKRVVCDVYNSSTEPYDRSFQSGTSGWLAINVQSTTCSNYHNSGSCGGVPGCTWYDECRSQPMMLSSYDGALDHGSCVPSASPAPSYSCDVATCGEVCSGSDYSACANYCGAGATANIWYSLSNCNLATCACGPFTVTDCNNQDCPAAPRTCQGAGTATIYERGNNYTCASGMLGCQPVGQMNCTGFYGGGPWTCDSAHECLTQACGGATYYCHYDAGAWSWVLQAALPATETSCSDTYNNDCDAAGADCADSLDCTDDANLNCCETEPDVLTPGDDGIRFGAGFFDAPVGVWPDQGTGNQGTAQCCGDDANEWYSNDGFGACCDQATDCVNATGSCLNHDTPITISHLYHCNNTVWDLCDVSHNDNRSGTYYCGFNATDGGWRWRPNMPAEICNDGIDNDGDGPADCLDHLDCDGVCPFCPVAEICNNDKDDDCDIPVPLIDGLDPDCEEGDGIDNDSIYRGCDDGIDNDNDGILDENEANCADVCEGTKDGRIMVFDNKTYFVNAFGVPCGVTFSSWEDPAPIMNESCCGNDVTEYYKNTAGNLNPSDDAPFPFPRHACCNAPTDCADENGNCQKGSEGVGDLTDCFDGLDNDCDGYADDLDTNSCLGATITGIIFDERLKPLGNAIVTASPPVLGTRYEKKSTPSNSYGMYTLQNAIVGTYNFIARKAGYDDNITKVTVLAGGDLQLNFTLRNGSCHDDCTDSYGNCNPVCNGTTFGRDENYVLRNCSFVSQLCAYRPKGFVVKAEESVPFEYIPGHTDASSCVGPECPYRTNVIRSITCCEGEAAGGASVTYPVIFPKISGDVKDVRVEEKMVLRNGEWIKAKFIVFWPND